MAKLTAKHDAIRCVWHHGNDRHEFTLPLHIWEDWLQGMITQCAPDRFTRAELRRRFTEVLGDLYTKGRGEFSWYSFFPATTPKEEN